MLTVDNFAGGGGASLGIEKALGRPVDIAVNHDPEAVAMHRLNHPATIHHLQDVWSVDPAEISRRGPISLAWFSPDCTHFSVAKGAAPIRPDQQRSRDLAWVVIHWARLARPGVIMLENVQEFMGWGPLLANGRPDKSREGETFRAWLAALSDAGYRFEWRKLRGCDYGSPTFRTRFFLVARRDGLPIAWPEPTHGPGRRPFRVAADCMDWTIPVHSIFLSRKQARKIGVRRPLANKTLARIARGVKRYVLDAAQPFIIPVTHAGDHRTHAITEPLRTIAEDALTDDGFNKRGAILPLKSVRALQRLLKGGGPADTEIWTGGARFRCRAGEVVTQFMDGVFPDYRRVTPAGRMKSAPLDLFALTEAVKAAPPGAQPARRGLQVTLNGKVTLTEYVDRYKVGEETLLPVRCRIRSDPIGFEARCLEDASRAFGRVATVMRYTKPGHPAVFVSPDRPELAIVQMPVRV